VSRSAEVALPPGWGRFALRAGAAPPPREAAAWAYDARGHRLCWLAEPSGRAACDLEWRASEPRPALARLAPPGVDFWRFWVLAELAAKLADVPILEWLRRYRRGAAPPLPAGARALVVPRWEGRWTLGFAQLAATPAAGESEPRRRSPWGFAAGHITVWDTTGAAGAAGRGLAREVI
jgi:hypothetical protein